MTLRNITDAKLFISNALDLTDDKEAGILNLNPVTGSRTGTNLSVNGTDITLYELTEWLQSWNPRSSYVEQEVGGFNSQALSMRKGPQGWEATATFVMSDDVQLHLMTSTPAFFVLRYEANTTYDLNVVVEIWDVIERWDRQLKVAVVDIRFRQAGKAVAHYT